MVFTRRKPVSRGVVGFSSEPLQHQIWEIYFARCLTCRRSCRVLPAELAPRKTYGKGSIEFCSHGFLDNSSGYRSFVKNLPNTAPHFTTLYRWITELGEFAREGGRTNTYSLMVHVEHRDSLLAKTASRRPDVVDLWLRSPYTTTHPCESQERRTQLESCGRLLRVAAQLFAAAALPLSAWDL